MRFYHKVTDKTWDPEWLWAHCPFCGKSLYSRMRVCPGCGVSVENIHLVCDPNDRDNPPHCRCGAVPVKHATYCCKCGITLQGLSAAS